MGGLSGVGKSALAHVLAPEIGRAPGALWLRSDVERKTMFGIEETDHLPASAYASDVTRDVYERLVVKARIALRTGQSVLIDATFAAAAERSAAAATAAELGVAFAGLFLDAPLATRLGRIGSRRADASDADADVARRQSAEPLAEKGWSTVAASGSLSDTTALARARLRWVLTGQGARIADHKMFMFGSVELRDEEQRARRFAWGWEWAGEVAAAPIVEKQR